ncbi:MAG: hypothetical protein K2H35_06300 [Muribaculaceae bacterium]|nr:hypothetical protein [Muribaculaceae bacterium]
MRKFIFPLAVVASICAFGQIDTNIGLDQFQTLSPYPGTFSLDMYEMGFSSITFNFNGGCEVNREANLFTTVTRNDEVIAQVPASNTKQISYDNFFAHQWCISFFLTPGGYESFAGGHYQVTIPEGFFLIGEDKTPNKEVVMNYYMSTPAVSIFPAESDNCTELQDFTITFGDAVKVERNPEVEQEFYLFDMFREGGEVETNPDDEDETIQPAEEDPAYKFEVTCEGNTAILHCPTLVTSSGFWCIDVPDKYFILTDAEGNVTYSQGSKTSFRFRIPTVTLEDQPVAEPAAGQVLFLPGKIELTLKDDQTLTMVNNMGKNSLNPINEDGTLGEAIADYRAASKVSKYYYEVDANGKIDQTKPIPGTENKVFLINQAGEDIDIYPAPGKYQLTTTKALYYFQRDGKLNSSPAFIFVYDVQDSDYFDKEFTPSPETAVSELRTISVKFPDADEIKVKGNTAWLRSAIANFQFYPRLSADDEQTVIFSTAVPVTLPGTYRLTSDTSSIEIDGEYVGIAVEYTISENTGVDAISEVKVLPAVFDIYNAQGILISKDANLEVLNALPAGIYIAGGKKFINR